MRQLHEGSSVQPGGETPASARAVHAILRWVQAASVSASEQTLLRIHMRALEALHMVAFFQLFVICLFPYDISFQILKLFAAIVLKQKNERQIRSKAAAEEMCATYELLRGYPKHVNHIGPEILDMVASATGWIQVCHTVSIMRIALQLFRGRVDPSCLFQDMEKCEQVLSDAKAVGLDASPAMKAALCTCLAAQGDTDEALKILERCFNSCASCSLGCPIFP
jgi:hypothetical protein